MDSPNLSAQILRIAAKRLAMMHPSGEMDQRAKLGQHRRERDFPQQPGNGHLGG